MDTDNKFESFDFLIVILKLLTKNIFLLRLEQESPQ